MRYVNPFVRGLRLPRWLRFSSTVDGQRPVTRSVGKPAQVASEFDWIPSPCSDGFRFGVQLLAGGLSAGGGGAECGIAYAGDDVGEVVNVVGFLLWVSRSQAMKGCLGGFADRGVIE